MNRNKTLQKLRGAPDGLLLSVAQFNWLVPVGTPVRYYPVAGDPEFRNTVTRSEAWALGHGEVVAMIEGQSGGVAVSHLELRR